MTLIVHGSPISTYTQLVLTTLEELGVDDYKLEHVDMWKNEHKSPEFMKLQPFGQIPVLQDGDLTMFESRAIARYLVEKYGNTTLIGKTAAERAVVNQWWEVESQDFSPPTTAIVYQIVIDPVFGMPETDEEVVAEQVAKLEKVLDVYEARLSSSKYLGGDSFTLADLSHLPYAYLLVTAAGKSELFTSRPHLSAWWKDISSRPTFQKVLALQSDSDIPV